LAQKIFSHYTDIVIFMLVYFILTHPIYVSITISKQTMFNNKTNQQMTHLWNLLPISFRSIYLFWQLQILFSEFKISVAIAPIKPQLFCAHNLNLLGSLDVTSHVTIGLATCGFL